MEHLTMCARMSRELGSRSEELGCILRMAELTLPSDPQQALDMVEDIQEELLEGANHENPARPVPIALWSAQTAGTCRNRLGDARVFCPPR